MKYLILFLSLTLNTNIYAQKNSTEEAIKTIFEEMKSYKGSLSRELLEAFFDGKIQNIEMAEKYAQDKKIPMDENIYKNYSSISKELLNAKVEKADDIFNYFEVADIKKYKLNGSVMGCTGDARTFLSLAKEKGLEAKYVITIALKNYIKGCVKDGKKIYDRQMGIYSGHQIVAIFFKESEEWKLINTSSYERLSYAYFDKNRSKIAKSKNIKDLLSSTNNRVEVYFNYPDDPYVVSYIGDKSDERKKVELDNYAFSGSKNSKQCNWPITADELKGHSTFDDVSYTSSENISEGRYLSFQSNKELRCFIHSDYAESFNNCINKDPLFFSSNNKYDVETDLFDGIGDVKDCIKITKKNCPQKNTDLCICSIKKSNL